MPDEFRIDYTILRRRAGEDDFAEIGFGSSGAWSDVAQAGHMVETDVTNGDWETSEGIPDPAEVTA